MDIDVLISSICGGDDVGCGGGGGVVGRGPTHPIVESVQIHIWSFKFKRVATRIKKYKINLPQSPLQFLSMVHRVAHALALYSDIRASGTRWQLLLKAALVPTLSYSRLHSASVSNGHFGQGGSVTTG